MGRTSDAKERLFKAAIELVWENSYGSVTIDAICEKADVKKGSFYYFFESKSDLIVAALEQDWAPGGAQRQILDGIFSPSVPPLERFRNYFKMVYDKQAFYFNTQGSVLGCACFSLGSEMCTQDTTIRDKVQDIFKIKACYFESAIRDAQAAGLLPEYDAKSRTACLFSFFEGSLGQARILNDLEPLRILPDRAMEILGAKVPSAA